MAGVTVLLSVPFIIVAAPIAAHATEVSPPPVVPTQAASEEPGAQASFEGETIDLAIDGWGEAHVCSVFGGETECFRTIEEAEAWEAELGLGVASVQRSAAVLAACSAPLQMWKDGGYGGDRVRFWDRGYWQNMTAWSFNDQMSSFVTGACGVHLAEHTNGGGYFYPGNTNANVATPVLVAGWNDRVSSIYIV